MQSVVFLPRQSSTVVLQCVSPLFRKTQSLILRTICHLTDDRHDDCWLFELKFFTNYFPFLAAQKIKWEYLFLLQPGCPGKLARLASKSQTWVSHTSWILASQKSFHFSLQVFLLVFWIFCCLFCAGLTPLWSRCLLSAVDLYCKMRRTLCLLCEQRRRPNNAALSNVVGTCLVRRKARRQLRWAKRGPSVELSQPPTPVSGPAMAGLGIMALTPPALGPWFQMGGHVTLISLTASFFLRMFYWFGCSRFKMWLFWFSVFPCDEQARWAVWLAFPAVPPMCWCVCRDPSLDFQEWSLYFSVNNSCFLNTGSSLVPAAQPACFFSHWDCCCQIGLPEQAFWELFKKKKNKKK